MNPDDDISTDPLCRIVCAALRHKETGLVIAGARHKNDVMRPLIEALGGYVHWRKCESGFIDQKGQFLTREQAWVIAERAGQIRQITGTAGTLYSEDLY